MYDLTELERRLDVCFSNKNLLLCALTHRSFINENRDWPVPHNERLELLGDAVLELIVIEYLLKIFPKEQEGKLTELRSALVSTPMLFQVADGLHLSGFIFLSRGQQKDGERAMQKICADAVEAILGALYQDQGMAAVERLVSRLFLRELMDVIRAGTKHAKTLVQEFSEKHFKMTPHYRTIEEYGPAHEKCFRVALCLGKQVLTTGSGRSKREAETEAAHVGYTVLQLKLRSTEARADE